MERRNFSTDKAVKERANHMKHCGTKRLETERLILRRFVSEDVGAMYKNWASDDEEIGRAHV